MMMVVTGGSGSGKSAFAEEQVLRLAAWPRIYIATMKVWDDEGRRRIERHRRLRFGKGFETVECPVGLKKLKIPCGSTVLLECMSNLAANEVFDADGAHENTVEEVLVGVQSLKKRAANLIIVTNEIFSDAEFYSPETRRYQEYLGEINRRIVQMSDQAVEVVYGIPVFIKQGNDGGISNGKSSISPAGSEKLKEALLNEDVVE